MKITVTAFAIALLLGLAPVVDAFAQETGDYQSATNGPWSDAATWSTFDGNAWVAATSAPDGSEHITVADTVAIDLSVSVTGYLRVEGTGLATVDGGSIEFADGATYEHARDAGSVPVAEWLPGSTFLLTGTEQTAPGNRNQSYYHVVLNTPNLAANRDLSLDDVTIGGDIHVISTGTGRWQLTSAPATEARSFNIQGDVIVEAGQFAVQGTGNAFTEFEVHHYGDVVVSGGNFSLARGSQGNGTGSTTWYLHEGNVTMSDATTQNSNPTPGQAKFVFAADGTQELAFSEVNYAGGGFHFDVAETATLEIADGFLANGLVTNYGAIDPQGDLTFGTNGVYDHARNGGNVPSATWAEGSTARFTGIVTDAPGNRGQDYYHLVLDTPDLSANRDLALNGNTISGDIHVVNTGVGRWQLVGGSSGTVTILGDVIMEQGQFAPQGTGSATEVTIDHYGDINVTGGNFSISRGSQGGELGEGWTRWYLHEGDFHMSGATTQNSNPWRATFVFAGDGEQELHLDDVTYSGSTNITVADGSTVYVTGDAFGGSGAFVVEDGGTLALTQPDGIDAALAASVDVSFDPGAGLKFAGTEAQVLGTTMPDTVGVLIIANPGGVTVSDTLYAANLQVEESALLTLAEEGSLTVGGGEVHGSVVNRGELLADAALDFGAESSYEHARNGGTMPSGNWQAGSTVYITGTVGNAPGNRNQSFYNLVFNSPDQTSNLNMGFNGVTIGGDIHVLSTGAARWYLTTASAQDSAYVTLMGDVVVEDGEFSVHGTGNALTYFQVDHYGDVVVTGGNFSIARGSQGSGSGSTVWYLHEGDFHLADARSQNSNIGSAMFVFAADGTQHLVIGDDADLAHLPIEVRSGTTLDVGTSEIAGNDLFTLESGATLVTAHVDGVAGSIQAAGTVTLDTEANFVFNGEEAQETSTLMPTVVNDLVINNAAGVLLSQPTTINGVLRLQAGVFDDTIPFTLGPEGSISFEGGSVVVSNDEITEIPAEFQLHQNYPNPFNPSTTIRYDVRENAHVTITVYDLTGRRVAELVDRPHAAGTHQVEWNANDLASGVYLYRIEAGSFSAVRSLTLIK